MQDNEILGRIDELVDEEHTLRERLQKGDLTAQEEHQRLRSLEVQLDQCWDLLRQRRARRDVADGDRPRGRRRPRGGAAAHDVPLHRPHAHQRAGAHLARGNLLKVALDLALRPGLGALGVLPDVAPRPTLAQKVPALVELHFE